MRSVMLRIQGMHCDGCAQTIKTLVEREPGVKSAIVTFESSEARILYDPATTDEKRLVTAVEEPGFRVVARRP
jgi:copper chaperone